MAQLICSVSSWSSVRDPDTGERVPTDADVSLEQAQRLADEYGPIGYEETDDGADICGEEMSDGSICERPADECPYHG